MAARALIFDLDGTLWRGHEWYATVLAGLSGDEPARLADRLASGENAFGVASSLGVSRARFVRAAGAGAAELYGGVAETLGELADRGVLLGVVTSLSREVAEPGLRHHGIVGRFGALEFAAGSKAPAIVRALGRLGASSSSPRFYVGDLPKDARAADRAGVSFAWASWGYASEVPAGGARLERFEEVLAL